MNTLTIIEPQMPVETMHEFFMENGYIVLAGRAEREAAEALKELAPHIEASPFGHDEFLGKRTKRVGGILAKSLTARNLALHPAVTDLCEMTFLPYSPNLQLNFSGIMHLAPGADAQSLHRDGAIYPVRHPCPPMVIATMWALTPFTEENGGTRIVPGSHLWEHDRVPQADEVMAVEMSAGSVLLYTGGVWHGGGSNRSASVRTGLALQYSWSWLRQEENQYLANPPGIAEQYDERLRRLIGYDFGGPYLGFVNGDDPHRVFETGHAGPPRRSRPEIDERCLTLEPLRLGDVEAAANPDVQGEAAESFTGPHISTH